MFIQCFSQEDREKLEEKGLKFFKEESGTYWFIDNKQVQFSDEDIKIKRTTQVFL